MSEPVDFPITLLIGEDEDFRLTITNELGDSVSVAKTWFAIKNDINDSDDSAILLLNSTDDALQFDMTAASSGVIDFTLTAAQTSTLSDSNEYVYIFKVKQTDGKLKYPVRGAITVQEGGIDASA